MNDTMLYSAADGVVTLTFNRPKVMNAIDTTMRQAFEAAVDRIEGDPSVRVVVLKGAGGGFMAGGDIKFFTEITPLPPAERSRRFEGFIHDVHPLIIRLRRLRMPVVASVHGPVAGIGMSFLMACDLAIAAEDAFFTLAYCHIGTSPDGGSSFFLPRTVGMKPSVVLGSGRRSISGPFQRTRRRPIASEMSGSNGAAMSSSVCSTQVVTSPFAESAI